MPVPDGGTNVIAATSPPGSVVFWSSLIVSSGRVPWQTVEVDQLPLGIENVHERFGYVPVSVAQARTW